MKNIIRIIKLLFIEFSNEIEKDSIQYKSIKNYKNNYSEYKKC